MNIYKDEEYILKSRQTGKREGGKDIYTILDSELHADDTERERERERARERDSERDRDEETHSGEEWPSSMADCS